MSLSSARFLMILMSGGLEFGGPEAGGSGEPDSGGSQSGGPGGPDSGGPESGGPGGPDSGGLRGHHRTAQFYCCCHNQEGRLCLWPLGYSACMGSFRVHPRPRSSPEAFSPLMSLLQSRSLQSPLQSPLQSRRLQTPLLSPFQSRSRQVKSPLFI